MTAEKRNATEAPDAAEAPDVAAAVPNLALLKSIVIGLGVLIVLGVIVLIVTVANRLGDMGEATDAEPVGRPSAFGLVAIPAGPQAGIAAASAGGGTILLTLRAPGAPDVVVVLDAATGQERGRIRLDRTAPADGTAQ